MAAMSQIEKFRLAFEVSPIPMLLVNGAGEIALANDPLCALFEYESDELIGTRVEALVPETIRAHHPELRSAYGKTPVKRSMGTGRDLYGVTKSGQPIPLELGLEPVMNGEDVWALVVAIDIRQRKRQEERMKKALDASASAMVMINDAGRIVFLNKAALTLFDYSEKDLLGHSLDILIPEEFKRAHNVYLKSYMSDTKTRAMGQGQMLYARRRDGHSIPVEIALTPVEVNDETLVMSTIIDLTERLTAKASLEQKNEELVTLNAELSQFAYSASHDLKAPLLSISGLLDLCIEDIEDGEVEGVLNNLQDAQSISARSAQKVEAVLQIARAGRERLPKEPVHIKPMMETVWLDVSGRSKAAELKLDLQHQDPVMLERATFAVIIENLLSNAYRYRDETKASSYVMVKTEDVGGNLRITISDNGIGIPEKNQPRVFDMFKRLDNRSESGLGLALVKKQVDRLCGTVTLSSAEGEGTDFFLTIPRGENYDEDTGGDR